MTERLSRLWRQPSAVLLAVQLSGVLLYPFMDESPIGRATLSLFALVVLFLAVRAVRTTPALTRIAVVLGVPIVVLTILEVVDPFNAQVVLWSSAQDRMSAGSVRERARRALVTLDDQEKAKEKSEETEKLAADKAAAAEQVEAEKPKAEPIPARITVDIVKQVLTPARAELQECIKSAKPELFQARLVLVVEDGELLLLSVVPDSLQSCIEPIVRKQKFPRTQSSKRESISYTIKRN